MQVQTFIAKSAADAIGQIRDTLGPDAVVLNVRRPSVAGLARFWQNPGIEVLAHVPEKQTPGIEPAMLAELREELREIRQKVESRPADLAEVAPACEAGCRQPEEFGKGMEEAEASTASAWPPPDPAVGVGESSWRVGALLVNSGLLPLHAQSVVEELRGLLDDVPPTSLAQELELARKVLLGRWTNPAPRETARADIHVFIGPPGSGKTTCLCKWLAQTVLVERRPASVWRLDGCVANTAESLSVFCEILGVPIERFPSATPARDPGVLFIDLPGMSPTDTAGLSTLRMQISQLRNPQVHLVLNAAYETPMLLAQVRAFTALPVGDLVVTHLDEEPRWGKLWNLVLGTKCSLRFLSAGQNIPGEFISASAEKILARQFPR